MQSPEMQGEECPIESGSCHRQFCAGPNSTGSGCSSAATPAELVPRNCGHAGGPAAIREESIAITARATARMRTAKRENVSDIECPPKMDERRAIEPRSSEGDIVLSRLK